MFNKYYFIIFIILNYFFVHLVSNMGFHRTLYAPIVPCICECWPEDGLIRPKHVATIEYYYLYNVVFWQ